MRRALLLLTLLLSACAGSGKATPPPVETPTTSPPPTTRAVDSDLVITDCPSAPDDFKIVCEVVDLVRQNYVDPVDPAVLAEAALQGVEQSTAADTFTGTLTCPVPSDEFEVVCRRIAQLDLPPSVAAEAAVRGITAFALDPNSLYLDPQARALVEEEQSGQVEGIGALVSPRDATAAPDENDACSVLSDACRLVVVAVLENSPAERAGLLPGDEIVAVDGRSVTGLTVDEVTALVRGPAGTTVVLGLRRDTTILEKTITRARVVIPVVETAVAGDVGYARLSVFTDDADRRLGEALTKLTSAGISRIVFDLRNNPGGALPAAVGVASLFLEEGVVLKTESPKEETVYEVRNVGFRTDLPVVVVVNGGSASASEVVAGALREAGRAIVVGQRTFGKNTVQQRFSLSNGGALRLTIARWVTAAGTDLGAGITPDVELELPNNLTPSEVVSLVTAAVDTATPAASGGIRVV